MNKKEIIIIIVVGVFIIGLFALFLFNPLFEPIVIGVEVCNGTIIATANANPSLCSSGCVAYKGEFVPYDTLRYLEELCEQD